MNKKTIITVGLSAVLLLGAIALASLRAGGPNEAAASATPPRFSLVKSRFAVPREMSASARGGQVFAPESVPGYAILKFDWERANGSSKGACVSVDSGNLYEVGPYCFASRQIADCNALISLQRPAGDNVTFGLVRQSASSVTVRSADRKSKLVPAAGGFFVTLMPKRAESCAL